VDLELTEPARRALTALERGHHVVVSGRAGTGKSTLLLHHLAEADLSRTVVLAPTGVAALNVGGETIHRFFRMWPGQTPAEAAASGRRLAGTPEAATYQRLETMIVDEVSMVRADLLDAVDEFCRAVRRSPEPFGGVRLVAFGDLYQLPPVVTPAERSLFTDHYGSPYFFSSHVVERLRGEDDLEDVTFVELEKVYRQADQGFVDLLNAVRTKRIGDDDLARINARVVDAQALLDGPDPPLYLTTTNARASQVNAEQLARLPGRRVRAVAEVDGGFPDSHRPTDPELVLAVGARVMLLTNDSGGRWVNGSTGTLVAIDDAAGRNPRAGAGRSRGPGRGSDDETADDLEVVVRLDDGGQVRVGPHTWEVGYSRWDADAGRIVREPAGSFTQLPLRLAWALTIHKAQGKTFDRVVVDFERAAFEHGQAYVALSRVRSLDGLALARPLRAGDVRLDRRIEKFLTGIEVQIARKEWDGEAIVELLARAIDDGSRVEMVYLKGDTTRTTRVVTPQSLGAMAYSGTGFPGLVAFCHLRGEVRTFNVDRILQARVLDE
jgi:hypothetical protein